MYNNTKRLKPDLVASHDIWPENREGLFWFWRFINLSLTHLLRYTYPLTIGAETHMVQTSQCTMTIMTY